MTAKIPSSQEKLASTIESNLNDVQILLKEKEFGLMHSLQTRSALVMFEFILRKLKEAHDRIKELEQRAS